MSRRALRTPQHSETRLTPRQTQVLDRVIRGLENKQIARELGVSEQAVKEQVSGLLQRLNVPNRAALAEAGTAQRITGTHAVERGGGGFAVQPLRGDDGEVDGVMVFSLDVTDQVRAREQLQGLTAEHLAVLDQIPSSVLVFNAEGRLIKINESGRRLIGVEML